MSSTDSASSADASAFQQARLGLFHRYGLDASVEWLEGPNGRRTAAVVGGSGETTLLVHGAISDAAEWVLVAPRLEGRVVAVDWPGCGLTPATNIREIGVRRFAVEWLDSVVDALGGGPVRIIGSSSGGYFGLMYALANPDKVDRLVQVGSLPGLTSGSPFIFRLFATPLIGRVVLGQQPKDAEANRKQVFSKLVADADRIPADLLEADLRATALRGAARNAHEFCRALVSPLTGLRSQNRIGDDELRSLAVPTRFLWGSEDNFVDYADVADRLEVADAVTTEIVDGGGHLMTVEVPDLVAQLANSFLGS